MGQAFKPVLLAEDSDTVTGHLSPGISYKLAEHAYLGSWFVAQVKRILTTPTRIAWVGDYGDYNDTEPGTEPPANLYKLADDLPETPVPDIAPGRYLINHDRRVYLLIDNDTHEDFDVPHPLPALTVLSGADIESSFDAAHQVGSWARQRISVADTAPTGYTAIEFHAWF
ncbi:hypothetical protein [Nocardia asteroides]|uniref:hypothetical protein n=1 Tax=Nocardia asteroides TaxID=1824 RepID=UPI0034319DCC